MSFHFCGKVFAELKEDTALIYSYLVLKCANLFVKNLITKVKRLKHWNNDTLIQKIKPEAASYLCTVTSVSINNAKNTQVTASPFASA